MCFQAKDAIASAAAEIHQQQQVLRDAAESKRQSEAEAVVSHYQEVQALSEATLVSSTTPCL